MMFRLCLAALGALPVVISQPGFYPTWVPSFVKYFDYKTSATSFNVSGTVNFSLGTASNTSMAWNLAGVDPACTGLEPSGGKCGIHIHEGVSCALAAGPHFWNKTIIGTVDPWNEVHYKGAGGASAGSHVLYTGLYMNEVVGRVVVVHDSTATKIACGVIAYQPVPPTTPAPPLTEHRSAKLALILLAVVGIGMLLVCCIAGIYTLVKTQQASKAKDKYYDEEEEEEPLQ